MRKECFIALRRVVNLASPVKLTGIRDARYGMRDTFIPHRVFRNPHLALNLSAQQKIRLGTCAWSFEEWRGRFYPAELPPARWLEFYARYFPAVEIDSTFYNTPAETTLQRWAESTPASFRFACKLPREITHGRALRDCGPELLSFVRALEPLGEKLHVILAQLPPSFAPKT